MAGSNTTVEHKLRLLIETQLDEKQKEQVGKQLKNILQGAAIGFDEAETKKNLTPIIRMIQKLFDKAEMKFDADKLLGMPSQQALQKVADITADEFQAAFDRALAKSGGIKIDFGNIDLSGMTEPLERLAGELADINRKIANDTKKSVDEIEAEIKRLDKTVSRTRKVKHKDGKEEKVKTKVNLLQERAAQVESTLNSAKNQKALTGELTAIRALGKAMGDYKTSVAKSDPWEIQYQRMITFVSKYEALGQKIKPIVDVKNPQFKELYDILAPKSSAAKISLEHFVDVSRGNELSEYKNQPWAREKTLERVAQALENGISVKDNGGDKHDDKLSKEPPKDSPKPDGDNGTPNKKLNTKVPPDAGESVEAKAARLAREAEEKVKVEAEEKRKQEEEERLRLIEQRRREEEKITKTIKERKPYVAFRSVESPEDSGKSKADALSDYGAEVWAEDKETAISYANDQYGTSSLLAARIRPVNPLVFDANNNFWSDFDQIPGLKEFFPNLLDYMTQHDEFETQKYIHEQAKNLGFDSVIFENIRDNLDAETDENADITTTIAVLDDRIVSLAGAFAQLEEEAANGSKMFDSNLSGVPEYYIPPEAIDPERYLQDLQDRQMNINKAYENIISSFNATLDEQKQKLQSAQQELANNPKSTLAREHVESAQEEIKNTEQIISKFRQQMSYNQKALQIEIDDYARILGNNQEIESPTENIDVKKQATEIDNVLFDKTVAALEKNHEAFRDYEEMMAASAQESIDEYRKGLDIYQRARRLIEEGYIDQNTEWMDGNGVGDLNTSTSLLPTAEGLEAHTYAPSDEQKEYVLKLGEEYRAIMEILKRGDSEFESALIERARAISQIMYETVRGSDGFLGHQYENAYGGSHQTAVSLEDWQQRDNLLHDVDSNKIDDSQRQSAIDLIYKEIEAEKQLEETRRQAREAAKQRELDTFKSQYASASAEDKKVLYELNELNNEWKKLDALGDETSHQAALSILEKIREKSNMLEKMNADLLDAYDDIGFKRAEPYINVPSSETPSAVPQETGAVKASIDTEELRNLLNAITYNVKVVQDVEPAEDKKVSIDEAALESVLNRIVYDVKIVHDDADKTANKIALDEGALEATLTKVFANIIRPEASQGTAEQPQEHWALESTLQNVKGVLDQIKDNTTPDKQPDAKNLIRDPRGNIVTAYRGTHDSYVGLSSNRYNGASFFTDSLDLARAQYAGKNGKVEAANLSMTNPLELDAHGGSWAAIEYIGDNADDASQKLHELQSKINQLKILIDSYYDAKPGSMAEQIASLRRVEIEDLEKEKRKIFNDLNNPYGRYTTDQIAERLPEWGYDGAIIKNLVDGGTIPSTVMISLDPSQVHYIETLSGMIDSANTPGLNTQQNQTDDSTSAHNDRTFALESTLQAVKGVLDNIQTNTTKIGTVEPSNVDTIAGTALDSRLAEIKSVLESIDSKIAKGGVIATRGAVKQANSQPVEPEARAQAARSNMLKSLINDYKTMGKLAAQFADDNNLETKAMLDNLKAEIARKRQSLNLTMDENKSLREKYSIAFDAEKRLLDAAKAQEKIDEQNKQNEKDEKAEWKKRVKDAQRETGINAADSTYRATNNTVIRAIGTEGISADIEAKAKELAEQNKALNDLRNEIDKKGIKASEQDRDNLSKQIAKVKELKTEVDGYLKIHEKYSGEGATQFDVDTSNFGAVGTNQYWNSITAAIKQAAEGRVAIKGMNADTGELTGTTKIAANTFAEWSATVDPVTGKLSMLRTGIKKTETIIEQITRKTKEIFTYFSGSSIIFKAFNELKKGVQYVKEIDLALTELKKVTDETEETYDKFLKTAAQTADKVGSTIQKVVSSTADWARLNI